MSIYKKAYYWSSSSLESIWYCDANIKIFSRNVTFLEHFDIRICGIEHYIYSNTLEVDSFIALFLLPYLKAMI